MRQTLSVICGVIVLFLSACGVKEWTMPQWDVTLRIPLINEKYYILDLADGENLIIDEDNVLVMQGAGSISTPEFGSLYYGAAIDTDPIPLTANVAINLQIPIVDQINQYELVYGVLESGTIETLFSNIAPSVQSIVITFHHISQPNGATLEILYETPGIWMSTDLTGCWIGTPNTNQVIGEMGVSINAIANEPNGSVVGTVQIRNQGGFRFSEFKGILHDYRLDMQEASASLDISYPLGIDQAVILTQVRLVIDLENHIGFDCTFHGDFFATNTVTGDMLSIPILDTNDQPFTIHAAIGGSPVTASLVMAENIVPLLQIMPDIIEIRNAHFIVSSNNTNPIGSVRMTDIIRGDYTVSSPFRFILTGNPIEIRDPIKVEITQQNQTMIRKNARSASFDFGITNRLPLGATTTVYIGTSPNIDADDPTTYSITKSATIQSANSNPSHQFIPIQLNNEELMIFANPEIYLKWVFQFESTNGVPVTIYATTNDFIQLRSMLTAELLVGEKK